MSTLVPIRLVQVDRWNNQRTNIDMYPHEIESRFARPVQEMLKPAWRILAERPDTKRVTVWLSQTRLANGTPRYVWFLIRLDRPRRRL